MRTVIVLLGGVALSFAVAALLAHFLTPDAGKLIGWMFAALPSNPQWPEVSSRWHHVSVISSYVIPPLTGLAVGLFVGLLQMRSAAVVAACCLLPDFLAQFMLDTPKLWAKSPAGILSYVLVHSLPFVAAALAAGLSRRAVHYRRGRSRGVPGITAPQA
jgi:hypothetical protein